ncbi:hypothetical protein [Streptomyces mirabilis]|uniref:hypothetical protein n=1 Tax=Streptomyces mirabilis TaxID=68239 RepID=UPI0036D99416
MPQVQRAHRQATYAEHPLPSVVVSTVGVATVVVAATVVIVATVVGGAAPVVAVVTVARRLLLRPHDPAVAPVDVHLVPTAVLEDPTLHAVRPCSTSGSTSMTCPPPMCPTAISAARELVTGMFGVVGGAVGFAVTMDDAFRLGENVVAATAGESGAGDGDSERSRGEQDHGCALHGEPPAIALW